MSLSLASAIDMECLEEDSEECLTYLKFPQAHWKVIRTSNLRSGRSKREDAGPK